MNKDFRVAVSLPSHPKALKLMRRCGDISFYNLVKFWAFVAQNRPTGDLAGLDCDDVEIAAGWNGQCSAFYQALLDLKFIEATESGLRVHDWEDHNGYAAHAKERSEKAKVAAETRWKKKNGCYEHTPSNATSTEKHAPSNAPYPSPNPNPSPNPDPSLKDLPANKFADDSVEVQLSKHLFSLIQSRNPKAKDPNHQEWAKHIDLMLRIDGRSEQEIRRAIDWCQADDFWFSVILSTKNFRKQYDKLYAAAQRQKTSGQPKRLINNLKACQEFINE